MTQNRLDYWNDDNTAHTVTKTIEQTNNIPVKTMFTRTINTAMTDIDQVAKFLCEFIYQTKAFRCYIGPYYLKNETTITYVQLPGDLVPCYIEWSSGGGGVYLGVI